MDEMKNKKRVQRELVEKIRERLGNITIIKIFVRTTSTSN